MTSTTIESNNSNDIHNQGTGSGGKKPKSRAEATSGSTAAANDRQQRTTNWSRSKTAELQRVTATATIRATGILRQQEPSGEHHQRKRQRTAATKQSYPTEHPSLGESTAAVKSYLKHHGPTVREPKHQ
jgi:hypothetical protein